MNIHNLFDLSGKTAIVTGSTKGIGKAIAQAFAQAGAKVVISSRTQDKCLEVAAQINDAGGEALAIACNISHKDQLQGLVDATLEKWQHIDILVCNAAVNPYYGPLAEIPEDAYDKIMDTNIKSNLWLCNMVMPQMAERRQGSVIIISSIAGLKGNDRLGAYGLSKAADMQLARNLAVEWGPANIRANCIARDWCVLTLPANCGRMCRQKPAQLPPIPSGGWESLKISPVRPFFSQLLQVVSLPAKPWWLMAVRLLAVEVTHKFILESVIV